MHVASRLQKVVSSTLYPICLWMVINTTHAWNRYVYSISYEVHGHELPFLETLQTFQTVLAIVVYINTGSTSKNYSRYRFVKIFMGHEIKMCTWISGHQTFPNKRCWGLIAKANHIDKAIKAKQVYSYAVWSPEKNKEGGKGCLWS